MSQAINITTQAYAINVTGIPMLALGTLAEKFRHGILTSVISEGGWNAIEGNNILDSGGKIELTSEECMKVVDVWQDLQINDPDALEIYASLKHCAYSGSDWEIHVFNKKHELGEITEARRIAVHYSDELDDQMEALQKQMEALHNKQQAALRSCARLDQMVRDRTPAKNKTPATEFGSDANKDADQ